MTTRTKTDKIRDLLTEGKLSTKEIADLTDAQPHYVRTVKQRMRGSDPNKRYMARLHKRGDRVTARIQYQHASRMAREAGLTAQEAERKATVAYFKSLRRTGAAAIRAERVMQPVRSGA